MKLPLSLALTAAAALAGSASAALQVTDDTGRDLRLKAPAQRIVPAPRPALPL